MRITAYTLAERFIGLKEAPGASDNPAIMAMLGLDASWPEHDEVPWCSAFVNYVAWLLRLPRSKSLLARSWLDVGTPIDISEAEAAFDVAVLDRGADVTKGHVGFFAASSGGSVHILGGNQSNTVSVQKFPASRVLSVRRLWAPEPDSRAW